MGGENERKKKILERANVKTRKITLQKPNSLQVRKQYEKDTQKRITKNKKKNNRTQTKN